MSTLKLRRLKTMALEEFKILNNQVPVYLHDMLNLRIRIILLGTPGQPKSQRCKLPVMASAHSATLQLNDGTP